MNVSVTTTERNKIYMKKFVKLYVSGRPIALSDNIKAIGFHGPMYLDTADIFKCLANGAIVKEIIGLEEINLTLSNYDKNNHKQVEGKVIVPKKEEDTTPPQAKVIQPEPIKEESEPVGHSVTIKASDNVSVFISGESIPTTDNIEYPVDEISNNDDESTEETVEEVETTEDDTIDEDAMVEEETEEETIEKHPQTERFNQSQGYKQYNNRRNKNRNKK